MRTISTAVLNETLYFPTVTSKLDNLKVSAPKIIFLKLLNWVCAYDVPTKDRGGH